MIRPRVKRTCSEPSSIALLVERSMHERVYRSDGDLNTVDLKSQELDQFPESQFVFKGQSAILF